MKYSIIAAGVLMGITINDGVAQSTKSKSAIPVIDQTAPVTVETATFALG